MCVCACVCECVTVCVCDTQLLIMLDDGNKYAANKFKSQHGLKQVASAFGIIGWTHTHTHTYNTHDVCVCISQDFFVFWRATTLSSSQRESRKQTHTHT